jgi:hypothetical protein
MNKKKEQVLVDSLMDMIPFVFASSVITKIASDMYRANPQMFWDYMRHKNENIIFNCRM